MLYPGLTALGPKMYTGHAALGSKMYPGLHAPGTRGHAEYDLNDCQKKKKDTFKKLDAKSVNHD